MSMMSRPHAHLQTMQIMSAKFQKEQLKPVGYTKYLLHIHIVEANIVNKQCLLDTKYPSQEEIVINGQTDLRTDNIKI